MGLAPLNAVATEPDRFRSGRIWGAAAFGALLASTQGAIGFLPASEGMPLALLFCLPLVLVGFGFLAVWLWNLSRDARRMQWRSVASTPAALATGAAAWWSVMAINPAAQIRLALMQPSYEADIASLPEAPGHRTTSWFWGDVGSAVTGGVSYHVLVYDETGAVRRHFGASKHCIDGGPCILQHIRGDYFLVTSHP